MNIAFNMLKGTDYSMSDFSRRLKKTMLAAAGIAVLAGAGGAWWYFSVYTKTPDYALQKIEESVAQNNKEEFYKYVDVSHVLDTTGDALLSGLVDSTVNSEQEHYGAVNEFSKMFKAPLVNILQSSVDNYVVNGQWVDEAAAPDSEVGSNVLLARTGFAQAEFKGIESLEQTDDETALVKAKVFQSEANDNFIMDVELKKNSAGVWQVYEITNIKEFVNFVTEGRKVLIRSYLEETNKMVSSYDASIREIEKNVHMAISTGSLGDNNLRNELADMMQNELKVQWQQEKSELEAMDTPQAAVTLQKLRLKICDANITYADNYAGWLGDKDIKKLRKAEESIRIARTLEKEAQQLIKQMDVHIQQ